MVTPQGSGLGVWRAPLAGGRGSGSGKRCIPVGCAEMRSRDEGPEEQASTSSSI